jgi:hypothetical protein
MILPMKYGALPVTLLVTGLIALFLAGSATAKYGRVHI